MAYLSDKITSQNGVRVNSNNVADLGSDYYFEKLVNDTLMEINNDIRRKIKKKKWYFLPSMEHFEEIKKRINKEFDYMDCGDYIKVKLK